ncbi:hypothetical protein EST38_g910 [Candolleomyces aberdarensis]|uniref:DUF7727 domain-containing protein n=1 Tax=Candolleomyces aberdarensis TaxID=2316362 RepID=A0A4Q2DXJ5_9AGAR|nr:hypothetical protein EST38_g910 [Candolleomyces aberdarensis]
MGNLVWHSYARFVSITASVYAVWAGFWGLFYRKYFFDFVGGTLRDPGGMQAPPSAAPFVAIIVKLPLVQIIAMTLGFIMLAMECPLPLIKEYAIYRSLVVRIVLLLVQVFVNILYYQGTNAAIWSFIAAFCYWRAVSHGELMEEAKENRGKGGDA